MSTNRLGYVEHPLNKSPSKTTYSFSKSERFGYLQSKEDFQFENSERRYLSPPKQKNDNFYQSSRKLTQRNSKSPQKGKRSPESPSKSPKRSGSKSPTKRTRFQLPYEYSSKNKSPERTRRENSRESVKKIKNKQLYPLGIQINNQGKYVLSNYENVKTASFGRVTRQKSTDKSFVGPGYYDTVNHSPENRNNLAYSFSKSPRKGPQDPYSDPSFGPGMYRTFSQFGQAK